MAYSLTTDYNNKLYRILSPSIPMLCNVSVHTVDCVHLDRFWESERDLGKILFLSCRRKTRCDYVIFVRRCSQNRITNIALKSMQQSHAHACTHTHTYLHTHRLMSSTRWSRWTEEYASWSTTTKLILVGKEANVFVSCSPFLISSSRANGLDWEEASSILATTSACWVHIHHKGDLQQKS